MTLPGFMRSTKSLRKLLPSSMRSTIKMFLSYVDFLIQKYDENNIGVELTVVKNTLRGKTQRGKYLAGKKKLVGERPNGENILENTCDLK